MQIGELLGQLERIVGKRHALGQGRLIEFGLRSDWLRKLK